MLTCGIPLFLLEVSVGQYLGVGGMSVVGQLCPILKGVGFSALMMVFLECVYYVIVVAWTLFYILNTFYNIADGLPWSSCEKGSKNNFLINKSLLLDGSLKNHMHIVNLYYTTFMKLF